MHLLDREHLDALLGALRNQGYTTIGPCVRPMDDGAVIEYREIQSTADLPAGWREKQEAAYYRLERDESPVFFRYTVGPQSWKQFLYPPRTRLFGAVRKGKAFEVDASEQQAGTDPADRPAKYAFLGVRACELEAIARLDAVFNGEQYSDPLYKHIREQAFIIAVQCGHAGNVCFCDSMKAGPDVRGGYDILLTELLEEGRHYFVLKAGSPRGKAVVAELSLPKAGTDATEKVNRALAQARSEMGRTVRTPGLRQALAAAVDSPVWHDIAKRCMTCANCTMVCPTCFCNAVEDVMDLGQSSAARIRRWDSCFTLDFAKVSGGNFRSSPAARYRQWLMHKFSNWHEQYGMDGCVGCGRCIVWCPAGIDVTAEVERFHAFQRGESAAASQTEYQPA